MHINLSIQRSKAEGTKNSKRFENIKKDLFKLNKNFLEDFKNYQVLKFNILKDHEEHQDKIIP